jgi:regulatory protein
MPIVTKLSPQRNKKRINVYLDGKFSFGIDLDNLVKYKLKIEKEFSQKEIDKIIFEAEFQKTFNNILNFATLRPRSEKEVFNWLKRKKIPEVMHKRLFNRLNHLDLLDDMKFSMWWIEQRNTFRPRGKRALTMELRQKGIDSNIIKKALEDSEVDEEKIAKRLLQKNEYKWKKHDQMKQKEKAFAFLARKGFSYDIIKNVVQYWQENDNA